MKIVSQILSIILLVFVVLGSIVFIKYSIKAAKQTRIKAEFTELTPFSSKIPVYFKGFKIGKVTKIEPNENFTSTLMHVTLFPEKIKFPENIVLQIKSYNKNIAYAEIDLPDEPSEKLLKDGAIIKGKTNMSFDSILEKQAENGSFDLIIVSLADAMTNTNNAIKETHELIKDIRTTFKNNENYITVTTRNISQATDYLSKTSVNINSTIDQKTLDKTMKNIEETTKNMKNITKNIDCATRNLSETMENINGITENVDGITNSVNCTMKSRFGGFRLIFGKSEQNCKCKNK